MALRNGAQLRTAESGIALLLALLFVVLLSAIVVEYAYENRVEASFVANANSDFQAELAAKSAVAEGMALLAADVQMDQITAQAGNQAESAFNGATAQRPQGLASNQPIDTLQDAWAIGIPYRRINDAAMQCVISDEFGKINLNALIPPEAYSQAALQQDQSGGTGQQSTGQTTTSTNTQTTTSTTGQPGVPAVGQPDPVLVNALRALFKERGAQTDPTDAILDWLDPDNNPRPNGAENDYYESLPVPYACKNGPMDSVEELLLVKGITPALFFGDPSKGQLPLTDLLTVHGQPRGRININTAPWEVLDAFGAALGGQTGLADRVVQDRRNNPITSDQDAISRGYMPKPPAQQQVQPAQQQANPNLRRYKSLSEEPWVYSSKVFRIQGNGLSGNAAVQIEAFVYRGSGAGVFNGVDTAGVNGSNTVSNTNRSGLTSTLGSATNPNFRGNNLNNQYQGSQLFRILEWRVLR